MSKEKLKPCPFCGGEARKRSGYNTGMVSCANEFCEIFTIVFSPKKWNTRHTNDDSVVVPKSELEQLKKHRRILANHMAEVKAIADGSKVNTLEAVVEHCLQEIKAMIAAQEDK